MNKSFSAFLFLLAITTAFAQIRPKSGSQNGLKSTKSGILKLYKDTRGFYALADMKYDKEHANDTLGNYSAPMMIGLYTNQTLLATKCLSFDQFDCDGYNCSIKGEASNANYPYFEADGNLATADLYLDYNNWILNSSVLIAKNCSGESSPLFGKNTSGIIGMGLLNDAKKNQCGSKVFSVYIQKDQSEGLLLFQKDTRYAVSSDLVAEYTPNENWEVDIKGHIQVGSKDLIDVETKLMFDLNTDAISFPKALFDQTLESLATYDVKCEVVPMEVKCNYTGAIGDLPNITIQDGKHNLSIPPQIYVIDSNRTTNMTSISLNIKPIQSNFTGRYFITDAYEDRIILDANFMAYYYVVFDSSSANSTIYIYQAGQAPLPGDNWVGPLIILIIFIVVVVLCYKYRNQQKQNEINNNVNTTQEPLVINSKENPFVPNGAQNTHYVQPQSIIPPKPINDYQPVERSKFLCCG